MLFGQGFRKWRKLADKYTVIVGPVFVKIDKHVHVLISCIEHVYFSQIVHPSLKMKHLSKINSQCNLFVNKFEYKEGKRQGREVIRVSSNKNMTSLLVPLLSLNYFKLLLMYV